MKKKMISIFIVVGLIVLLVGILVNDNTKDSKLKDISEVKARVVETDNSEMIQSGISKIGNQMLQVKVLEGEYKGEVIQASNHLMGKLQMDNYYEVGDKIVISIVKKDGKIFDAKAIDLYRQQWQFLLFAIFVLALIIFAGYVGLKALFSFIASLFVIWTILIPGLLEGQNPLVLASICLVLLSGIILFSIAGFTRKGLAAFLGTMSGLLATVVITIFFGNMMRLGGMTAPFAETLLFSGHLDLNMKYIFYAAVIIGASGAAMDIAIDIAASMEEVKVKKPDISAKELIQSGFNVGRSVIGTMTTTLLLAYSGGYLTLLMLFMTKKTSFARIINFKMVAAEILRTVTGSIGLVLVAPITALIAGWIYTVDFNELIKNRNK